MSSAKPLDAYALALQYVRDAVGDAAHVDGAALPGARGDLPGVIVTLGPPSYLDNGPRDAGGRALITCQCYGGNGDAAYDLALLVERNFYAAWERGHLTDYGGVAHIVRQTSTRPYRVANNIANAAPAARFDIRFDVVLRQP